MRGTCTFAVLVLVARAAAQPASAALDDLRQRSSAALRRIARAENWTQAVAGRESLRSKLRQSLRLPPAARLASQRAFLYEPLASHLPKPAIVLLRPHEDPSQPEARILAAALTQAGFVVLEPDAHAAHENLQQIVDGVVPPAAIQASVKAALAFLGSRDDIDPKRIALVGNTLSTTMSASLNPEFAAIVAIDAVSDSLNLLASTDNCHLIPGFLQYAATEELLSLIAPRPLLLFNAHPKPVEYVTELYRGAGALPNIRIRDEDPAPHFAIQAFLAEHLQIPAHTHPPREPSPGTPIALAPAEAQATTSPKTPITEALLTSLLGAPLPQGRSTVSLNCKGDHNIHFYPQLGLRVPVAAIRPGPDACDASRGTLIAVDDRGRNALLHDPVVQEATRRGWIVWMPDPRHIGEMNTDAEPIVFSLSLLLGENAAWRQSADILGLVRRVAGGESRYPTVLYARGGSMALAASYVAAIADRREIETIVLLDAASTWTHLQGAPPFAFPIGAQRAFDIHDLWKAARPSVLVINGPGEFIEKEW